MPGAFSCLHFIHSSRDFFCCEGWWEVLVYQVSFELEPLIMDLSFKLKMALNLSQLSDVIKTYAGGLADVMFHGQLT